MTTTSEIYSSDAAKPECVFPVFEEICALVAGQLKGLALICRHLLLIALDGTEYCQSAKLPPAFRAA